MSHPFGDQLSHYLHRKHGLSQAKLAAGILQAPAIITDMAKGRRLRGAQARERVVAIIEWLQQQGVLEQIADANALLDAAGMAALQQNIATEAMLLVQLTVPSGPHHTAFTPSPHPTPRPFVRHNLPPQLTPLIGRAQQVNDLTQHVLNTRLLTLTGPPGVGKTRLAFQVGNELIGRFADGVFFTALAPVQELADVPTVVCQALSLQESGLSAVERLKLYLQDKHLLLLLDNFEQLLISSAQNQRSVGEEISWIAELLATCPRLHLLITSRAPLRMRAERQFPITPLALPDLSQTLNYETIVNVAAVALFVERAQAVQPTFALTPQNVIDVATLCVRLDGLPLAIELVVAHIKLLPPAQLLARLNRRLLLYSDGLRDSVPRQQTLRDAIRWSYDLLTPAEQKLFARLGLFTGGFTLQAAEAVCNVDGDLALEILDGLAALLDKHLITQKLDQVLVARFGMLELIHEYALERLEMSQELSGLRRCHAAYYLHLVEEADSHLRSAEQLTWFQLLEVEHHNLRAVLAWCVTEEGDPLLGLRLVNALSWFWFVRCYYSEGSRWIDRLLAITGDNIPMDVRAWTFSHACQLAVGLDAFARGRAMGEAALALAREVGDQQLVAYVTPPLSNHFVCLGELHLALHVVKEGLEKARHMVDARWETGRLLYMLGCLQDASEEAAKFVAEGLPLAYQLGDRWLLIYMLGLAERVAAEEDNLVRAARLSTEMLSLARELQDNRFILLNLEALGDLAYRHGRIEQAAAYYHEGFEIARQTGTPGLIALFLRDQGHLAQQRGELSEAIKCYRQALLWVQKLGHKMFIARCLLSMAMLAETSGALAAATRLMGAVEALYNINIIAAKGAAEDPNTYQLIATIYARLADPSFAAVWAAGQAMTLDEAIAYAMTLDLLIQEPVV